jgi:hypothetical protein
MKRSGTIAVVVVVCTCLVLGEAARTFAPSSVDPYLFAVIGVLAIGALYGIFGTKRHPRKAPWVRRRS